MSARSILHVVSVPAAVLVLLLCAAAARAQTATGSIEGLVVDSTGAVLPGVAVTIVHQGTGVSREVVSDAQGLFRAPLLPVGAYTVRSTLSGFIT